MLYIYPVFSLIYFKKSFILCCQRNDLAEQTFWKWVYQGQYDTADSLELHWYKDCLNNFPKKLYTDVKLSTLCKTLPLLLDLCSLWVCLVTIRYSVSIKAMQNAHSNISFFKGIIHPKTIICYIYLPSDSPRFRWVYFIMGKDLEKLTLHHITIIHTTPVHQLISCETKNCAFVINKSIIKSFHHKDNNWLTGEVWIFVMFLSAVWRLILTAPIHCRGSTWWTSNVMLNLSKSFLIKTQSDVHLQWPESEYINISKKISFLGELFF